MDGLPDFPDAGYAVEMRGIARVECLVFGGNTSSFRLNRIVLDSRRLR